MARLFELKQAKRDQVPLLVGLGGASGCGKTFSAIRLATGMQRVTGGDIHFIDTESRRALHYADQFSFKHLEFGPPFSPLDYLDAIAYCVGQGASIVITDSMSHEHEGPGGVLEMHDAELDRMAGQDFKKRNKLTFAAWAEPKKQRRRLINEILRLGVSMISCFRAKEKIRIVTGKDPIHLGWMPIGGEEFVFEQTVQCLLYPGSGGVPTWEPELPGERAMTKLPSQFFDIFKTPQPLSEDIGEKMARWAAGDAASEKDESAPRPTDEALAAVLAEIGSAGAESRLIAIAGAHRDEGWSGEQRAEIKRAIVDRRAELLAGNDPRGSSDPDVCNHPDGFGLCDESPEIPICIHCKEPQE